MLLVASSWQHYLTAITDVQLDASSVSVQTVTQRNDGNEISKFLTNG
jgi:hypothetical protein